MDLDEFKEIPLTRGKVALVDPENYEWLMESKWQYATCGYAVRKKTVNKKQTALYMHREIMRALPKEEIDHINGNKLDNRRCNLRVCSHRENLQNIKVRTDSKSGYTGVTWDKRKKRWRATIQINTGQKSLGTFGDVLDAAYKYNEAAKLHYGQYARLNVLPDGFKPGNSHLRSSNTSGYAGVGWHKVHKKWGARVKINGKEKHVGYFDSIEEAVAAQMAYKS